MTMAGLGMRKLNVFLVLNKECNFLRVDSYFENNFEPLYFRGTDPDNGFEEVKRDAGFLKKPSSQTDKQSGVPFQQTMRNPKI